MVRLEKSRSGMHRMDGRPSAQRRSLMKQKLGAALPPPPPESAPVEIVVDYPRSGERVVSREYSFRIAARDQGLVEISIDDGAWRACRPAAGYWWNDWSDYRDGLHVAVARLRLPGGREFLSVRSEFYVDFA